MSFFRSSFIGQVLYFSSGRRILQYVEERPGFQLPDELKRKLDNKGSARHVSDQEAVNSDGGRVARRSQSGESQVTAVASHEQAGEVEGEKGDDTILVDWYGPDDAENPQNWSTFKKCWTTFCIMLITTSVYMGSSIYSPATEEAMEYFGVSQVAASLGLSLFVAGYGVGPLFLSPISEIPAVGRNLPYITTLGLFCVLQVPTALVNNFGGFLVLRFLAGFVGSPPLATGGASLQDCFAPHKLPYSMGLYGLAAASGPALAPIVSGFAVESESWRWAFWEMLWLSGFSLILLSFTLPETSSANILFRRAARLRRLTGSDRFKSQGEIDSAHMTGKDIALMTLVRPFTMTFTEPIVLAIDLYIGLVYMILYSYFESFPLVYTSESTEGYGWSLGVSDLPFAALLVGAILSYAGYTVWNRLYFEPRFLKSKGNLRPEERLPMSFLGAFCFPICLFWFGWTANRTSWVSPTIAASFFGIGATWMFMPFLTYLPQAYPAYAASVLASNDFVRSMMGAGMPIVANPLFKNLGVDWGNTLLGCLTILFIPIPFALYKFGPWLRNRSPMALHDDAIREAREKAGGDVAASGV